MKILLINNNTQHMSNLTAALAGHGLEVRQYHPGLDFNCADKDLVILSGGGGEGLEIYDEHRPGKLWYDDQMDFIRSCQKPLLGICMGFEVISRAFGAKVEEMVKGLEGFTQIYTTTEGQNFFAKKRLKQYEAHDWCVPKAPDSFRLLAKSKSGAEIIQHNNRPIIATQFHPEKGGTLKLSELVYQLNP